MELINTMRKITITEALVELKLLDSRIKKAIAKKWCYAVKKNEMDKADELKKDIKSNYQSVLDLIQERQKIKAAIVKSNAKTQVDVAGVKMTVAEAIEYKSSIAYEEHMKGVLMADYANTVNAVTHQNSVAEENVKELIAQIASSDTPDIADLQNQIRENYMANNGFEIVDGINIEKAIEELDQKIDDFKKNVDTALALSNAITFIQV